MSVESLSEEATAQLVAQELKSKEIFFTLPPCPLFHVESYTYMTHFTTHTVIYTLFHVFDHRYCTLRFFSLGWVVRPKTLIQEEQDQIALDHPRMG